jgi:hypothetical protein
VNPPRTHDLVFLYQKVKKRYPRLSLGQEELEFLNGLYIESRYPADLGLLPEGEPTAADARRALAIAREFSGRSGKFWVVFPQIQGNGSSLRADRLLPAVRNLCFWRGRDCSVDETMSSQWFLGTTEGEAVSIL